MAAADERVHVLHRTEKAGLGAAYVAGFGWALDRDYGVIVEMDADGSHAPEDLPRLLDALTDADLALGSRYVPGGRVVNWPKYRELISRGGGLYSRIALGAQDPGHHRRLQGVPPRGAGEDQHHLGGLAGLLLPDRPHLAHHRGRLRGRGGAHHLHRARRRRVQDERLHRARGLLRVTKWGVRRAGS